MDVNVDYTNKIITFTDATLEELAMTLVYDFPEEEYEEFQILIA